MVLTKRDLPVLAARRTGVSEATLYRWRDEFLTAGEAALANGGEKQGVDPRDRRIAELEQQIEKRDQRAPLRSGGRGEYTIANRILKKLSGQSL